MDYQRKPSQSHPSRTIRCELHGEQMRLGIHCAECERVAREAAGKEKKAAVPRSRDDDDEILLWANLMSR